MNGGLSWNEFLKKSPALKRPAILDGEIVAHRRGTLVYLFDLRQGLASASTREA
jgi:hypothetical protein